MCFRNEKVEPFYTIKKTHLHGKFQIVLSCIYHTSTYHGNYSFVVFNSLLFLSDITTVKEPHI